MLSQNDYAGHHRRQSIPDHFSPAFWRFRETDLGGPSAGCTHSERQGSGCDRGGREAYQRLLVCGCERQCDGRHPAGSVRCEKPKNSAGERILQGSRSQKMTCRWDRSGESIYARTGIRTIDCRASFGRIDRILYPMASKSTGVDRVPETLVFKAEREDGHSCQVVRDRKR
jgi:hypothetical protein